MRTVSSTVQPANAVLEAGRASHATRGVPSSPGNAARSRKRNCCFHAQRGFLAGVVRGIATAVRMVASVRSYCHQPQANDVCSLPCRHAGRSCGNNSPALGRLHAIAHPTGSEHCTVAGPGARRGFAKPLPAHRTCTQQIFPARAGTRRAQTHHRLLARACPNCHSAVHGSNHPSGREVRDDSRAAFALR